MYINKYKKTYLLSMSRRRSLIRFGNMAGAYGIQKVLIVADGISD